MTRSRKKSHPHGGSPNCWECRPSWFRVGDYQNPRHRNPNMRSQSACHVNQLVVSWNDRWYGASIVSWDESIINHQQQNYCLPSLAMHHHQHQPSSVHIGHHQISSITIQQTRQSIMKSGAHFLWVGQVSRFNADTTGVDCNRSEGKARRLIKRFELCRIDQNGSRWATEYLGHDPEYAGRTRIFPFLSHCKL